MDEGEALEVLTVRGVSAGYRGRRIVADISVALRFGDVLGLLVGEDDSVKSTLLKAVTGQIRLMAGTVAIAGVDLAHAPERARLNSVSNT